MYRYECVLNLGQLNPVRYANSKEEFIENLLQEYNYTYGDLFYITRSDITDISTENWEEEESS
jgi:hypothetical protein